MDLGITKIHINFLAKIISVLLAYLQLNQPDIHH